MNDRTRHYGVIGIVLFINVTGLPVSVFLTLTRRQYIYIYCHTGI